MLRLNNIEVIYSDVILVLKGLSLEVPRGKLLPCWGQRRREDDDPKGDFRLAENGKRPGDQRNIELMGRRIDGMDPDRICRLGILQVMEGRKVLESPPWRKTCASGYTRRDQAASSMTFR